jgi:AcrR family transcriptional regulator
MVKKDEIRGAIVNTSRQIFCKQGFRKTTMEEIAEAVQKGKSSIYYYFESKEEIFKAVVWEEAKIFRKTVLKAIGKSADPKDKVKQYIMSRMQTAGKVQNFLTALKDEDLKNLGFIAHLNKIYDEEEIQLFTNILKEGVDQGFFELQDIDLAAIAIVTAMKGMEKTLAKTCTHAQFEKKLEGIINIVFYGIIKR